MPSKSQLSQTRRRTKELKFLERTEIVEVAQTIPQERIPKRILEQIVTLTCHKWQQQLIKDSTCWTSGTLKVKQVVNTFEVKTLKIIEKTMQGEKVDPDDDQSSKDQSDLFDQDSSDSVLSRSSEFRKSCSKSRTRKDSRRL